MNIGVLGLGTIGLKLAEYFADRGFSVIAYNYRNLDKKKIQFDANVDDKNRHGKFGLEKLKELKSKVTFVTDLSSLSNCEIIFEALQENYSVKDYIYNKLSDFFNNKNIIATTTSSLSLEKLNKEYFHNRFIGVHFFNPPTKMKLIEVSYLSKTSCEVKEKITHFLEKLEDKTVIEMPVVQGYIVNNLLLSYINHAVEFCDKNNIDITNVDMAMKLGTNAPMGPLELSDYIGNDVCLQILNELYSATNDLRFFPSKKLIELVNENKLGKKTGEGFYKY